MKKILLIFILILFMINFVSAKSTPEFIEHLTNIVYEDCGDSFFEGKIVTRDWYKEQITKVDNQLPTGLTIGEIESFPEVLWCNVDNEKYSLRVNFDEYYWRDMKVGNSAIYNFISQRVENVVAEQINQIAITGDGNYVRVGGIYNFKFYLTISLISFGFSLAISLIFLFKKKRK